MDLPLGAAGCVATKQGTHRRFSCSPPILPCPSSVGFGWPAASWRMAGRCWELPSGFQVSPTTAKRWSDSYRLAGPAGMRDRLSRPHHSPTRTPRRLERNIVHLRRCRGLGTCAGLQLSQAQGGVESPTVGVTPLPSSKRAPVGIGPASLYGFPRIGVTLRCRQDATRRSWPMRVAGSGSLAYRPPVALGLGASASRAVSGWRECAWWWCVYRR